VLFILFNALMLTSGWQKGCLVCKKSISLPEQVEEEDLMESQLTEFT